VIVMVTLQIVMGIVVEPTSLMYVVYVMEKEFQKVHVIVKITFLIVKEYVMEMLHMITVEFVGEMESQKDSAIVLHIM